MLTVVCPHCLFTVMWQLHQSQALMKGKRDGQVSICVKQLNFLMSQEWMCLCCAWWVWERVGCLTYQCCETALQIQPSCSVSPSVSPLSHHHFSWYSFFYSVGLHRPHLLSTLRGLQNKAGKSAVSVKDGKSPWGDDRGTKKWRKERGGKKERVRQWGGGGD